MSEEVKTEKADFQIFGSVDLNEKGNVKSVYPSWYFDYLRDDLQNEVDRMETDLTFDKIPRSEIAIHKERLAQKRDKLLNLDQAALTLRGKQKDKVSKVYDDLGREISSALFTRDQMRKGLADPREEMKRMTEPCIEVRGDAMNIAKACNVKVTKGKVTRDGASKVWKILGKALGDSPTNVEYLRRD